MKLREAASEARAKVAAKAPEKAAKLEHAAAAAKARLASTCEADAKTALHGVEGLAVQPQSQSADLAPSAEYAAGHGVHAGGAATSGWPHLTAGLKGAMAGTCIGAFLLIYVCSVVWVPEGIQESWRSGWSAKYSLPNSHSLYPSKKRALIPWPITARAMATAAADTDPFKMLLKIPQQRIRAREAQAACFRLVRSQAITPPIGAAPLI